MSSLEAPRSARSVWLLSFGDLLTLLVAYFVLAVGFKIKEHQTLSTSFPEPKWAGIQVADSSLKSLKIVKEVVLFDTQIMQGSLPELGLSQESGTETKIEVCSLPKVSSGELARRIARALEKTGNIQQVDLYGEDCEGLKYFTPVTGKVVGVIRVTRVNENG